MRRLLWAALLSAALHAAVLGFNPGKHLQPPALSGSREPIVVSLAFVGAEKKTDPPAVPASKPRRKPSQPAAPVEKASPVKKAPPPAPPPHSPANTHQPVVKAQPPEGPAATANAGNSPPSPDGTRAESPTSAGNTLKPAVPLYRRNPPPPYPRMAKARGYQGRTLLNVLVGRDGRVLEAAVAASSGYSLLDEAALNAVVKWLFEPAKRGDEPVAMWVKVPIRFQIR